MLVGTTCGGLDGLPTERLTAVEKAAGSVSAAGGDLDAEEVMLVSSCSFSSSISRCVIF